MLEGRPAQRCKISGALRVGGIATRLEFGQQVGDHDGFQAGAAHIGVAILARHHFALFGDAQAQRRGALRQRADRVIAGTAAAAHRAATAMEKAHANARLLPQRHQPGDAHADFPVGGDITAILVAVGIANHHFLQIVLCAQHGAYQRMGEIFPHYRLALAQVGHGFEQRHDAQGRPGRIARHKQPGLLHQDSGFQHVRNTGRLGDDVVGHCAIAEAALQQGGTIGDLQLAQGFGGVFGIRRTQRARAGKLGQQHIYPRLFIQVEIVGHHLGGRQQLGHGALMHVRILTHIHRRQMEAKRAHRLAQFCQAAFRQVGIAILAQRLDDHVEVGNEGFRRFIGGRNEARRILGAVTQQRDTGRSHAGIAGDQGAAVGFVRLLRRGMFQRRAQSLQRITGGDEVVGNRQLHTQAVDFRQIMGQHRFGLVAHRIVQRFRRDEGIAVAVAAHPGTGTQESRRRLQTEQPGHLALHDGDLADEGAAEDRQRILDLVGDMDADGTQHARLPQDANLALQARIHLCLAPGLARLQQR